MSTVTELVSGPDGIGAWTAVPDRSRITFKNKTMWGLSTVGGRFTEFSGHGRIADAGEVSGQIDIEAASVDTGLRARDRHLRSADFFKVQRFPQISIVVTGAVPSNGDTADLEAFITVTGTTQPLPLQARVNRLEDGAVRVSTETTIDHDKLGIHWNMLWMLSRKTRVSADVVFRRDAG